MRLVRLAPALILATLAFALSRALLTRDGIGVLEWLVAVPLLAALAFGALRSLRAG